MLEEQQHLIDKLQSDLRLQHEEFSALHECLTVAGILAPDMVHRALQRRRYFDIVLQINGVALAIGVMLGPQNLQAAGAASTGFAALAETAWPAVRKHCPENLYIFGGCADRGQVLNSAERLCTTTKKWEVLPPMSQPRRGAVAGAFAGKLYICGGCSGDGIATNSVECFDPCTRTWQAAAPMLKPRLGSVAGIAADGMLYLCGGWNSSERCMSCVERLGPSGVWEAAPSMSEPRRWPAGGCNMNGMFYVSGGLREETPPLTGFRPLESVECFDCANGEWRSAPPLCGPRVAAASATLNETLYICGGWLNERAQNSVERLKAGASAWEVVQPMSMPRFGASTTVAFGLLHMFGGYSGGERVRSAESFDPVKQTWTPLPPMLERRASPAMANVPL